MRQAVSDGSLEPHATKPLCTKIYCDHSEPPLCITSSKYRIKNINSIHLNAFQKSMISSQQFSTPLNADICLAMIFFIFSSLFSSVLFCKGRNSILVPLFLFLQEDRQFCFCSFLPLYHLQTGSLCMSDSLGSLTHVPAEGFKQYSQKYPSNSISRGTGVSHTFNGVLNMGLHLKAQTAN